MAQYIEVKVRYDKMQENGLYKTVTEPFVVDALSCTEAEQKIIEHMKAIGVDEYNVMNVTKMKISEASHDEGYWYKARYSIINIDNFGNEKRAANYFLIEALSFDDAYKRLNEMLKGTVADIDIESLVLTKVQDVIEHDR